MFLEQKISLSQAMMFQVGMNNSEPNINSESRDNKFWMIPRNTIDTRIYKLEMSNLKFYELRDSALLINFSIMTTWK